MFYVFNVWHQAVIQELCTKMLPPRDPDQQGALKVHWITLQTPYQLVTKQNKIINVSLKHSHTHTVFSTP